MRALPLAPALFLLVACRMSAAEPQVESPSLKDASDAEILRYMADGKSEIDSELDAKIKDHLPNDFWVGDAKAAALALVEANRRTEHRAAYAMSLASADPTEPPGRCTVTLANFSSRDYNAVDRHYFLRVDPHESYLAYAESWSGGEAFYNVVHNQPAFNFRLCRVSYEDGRKIADVIWWLNRIQTKPVTPDFNFTSSIGFSTADGFAKLTCRGEGSALIEVGASHWADYLAERWSREYDPEVFLNFASYLIQTALPEHLGSAWAKFEPRHPPDFDFDRVYTPRYEPEERQRLRDLTFQFLDWFALDQDKISFAIVAEAARVSGRFGISDAADRLRVIEKALPSAQTKRRSGKEVLAALKKLPQESRARNEKERKQIEEQRAALDRELQWHVYDRGVNTAENVRESVVIALRRLALANDAAKLEAWALSKSEGMQWAMERLAELDKKRYAHVLEIFATQGEGKWARQFFDELVNVDPKRARAVARRITATRRDAIAISALLALRDAAELPDEHARPSRIIKILEDRNTDWKDQERAIDLLVPRDTPLRYPDRQIDRALVGLLDRKRKDNDSNYVAKYACRALARRGRTEFFDRIAAEFSQHSGSGLFDDLLGALTHLAQADPVQFNPRLTEIVTPHLAATNNSVTELFWTIWAADLRELLPELQRLATQNADEIESRQAHTSGGDVTNVKGRFHLARKIVSVWSEPDSFTRARLLIAFAIAEPYSFVRDDAPERVARLKAEMRRAANDLSPEAKRQLAAMLDRIDANADQPNTQVPDEIRHKSVAFAREALGL